MKSTLVVIFNHDFSKNIPKLNRVYGDRFSEILYLVPDHFTKLSLQYRDYTTNIRWPYFLDVSRSKARRLLNKRNPNELNGSAQHEFASQIVRVVGYKFQFYHYICQAWNKIRSTTPEWVWVIGDDVLLNSWFDESAFFARIDAAAEADCVLCKPEAMSHQWVTYFEGSVNRGEEKLSTSLDYFDFERLLHAKRSLVGERLEAKMLGGCSDFFGMRFDLLPKAVEAWKKLFLKKMFVELAVPNVLSAVSRNPIFVDDYIWDFGDKRNEWEFLSAQLFEDEGKVFAHPIKFSEIDDEDVAIFARHAA